MTTARRSSSLPIRIAAARPIRSPRIPSTRRAIRSSSSIPRVSSRWRRRSSSHRTLRSPAFATANSSAPESLGRGASSSKALAVSARGRYRSSTSTPRTSQRFRPDVLVYGRNGVQARPVVGDERELGIIIETTSKTQEGAVLLASLLTHYLIHYGYPGRKATAGNIAYPLSPNLVAFRRADGSFGAVVPSGTRDPVFFENYGKIKAAVLKLIEDEFPDALANATYKIVDADASNPVALVRTVDRDRATLEKRHAADVARVTNLVSAGAGLAGRPRRTGRLRVDALSSPAERDDDQGNDVPDHLLPRQRQGVGAGEHRTADLFRHRRHRLQGQCRRSHAVAYRRRAARGDRGMARRSCSTWRSSSAARMPASTG